MLGPCTCTLRKRLEARRSPCRRSGARRTRRAPRSMRPYPHSAEDRLPWGRPRRGGLSCCQGPHHSAILVQTRDMEGRLRLFELCANRLAVAIVTVQHAQIARSGRSCAHVSAVRCGPTLGREWRSGATFCAAVPSTDRQLWRAGRAPRLSAALWAAGVSPSGRIGGWSRAHL